jgi:hypothetical protein
MYVLNIESNRNLGAFEGDALKKMYVPPEKLYQSPK